MRDYESTLVGDSATFVVVDDPHGHVVPSEGVKIIGHLSRSSMALGLLASQFMNMGPNRTHEIERKVKREEFPRDIEPYSRKKARKSKQRLKGLRP